VAERSNYPAADGRSGVRADGCGHGALTVAGRSKRPAADGRGGVRAGGSGRRALL
jgi:hypothetical protein